jgi:lipooligosaccharide transport system permease protein
MQTATFESSFPIVGKMSWRRNYEAICATPVRVIDVVLGELMWIGVRLLTVATAFAVVLAAFRIDRGPLLVVAVPAAVLTGLAFSAVIIAFAGTLKTGADFNVMFRFVITPLLLFSGVFFPITRLPWWLQIVATFTPLYHGVELVRGLVLQMTTPGAALLHAGYLLVMLAFGTAAAYLTFSRRLKA